MSIGAEAVSLGRTTWKPSASSSGPPSSSPGRRPGLNLEEEEQDGGRGGVQTQALGDGVGTWGGTWGVPVRGKDEGRVAGAEEHIQLAARRVAGVHGQRRPRRAVRLGQCSQRRGKGRLRQVCPAPTSSSSGPDRLNARARQRCRTGNVEVRRGRVGFQERSTERQARQIAVDGGGGRAKGGRRHARDPVKQDRQLSTEGGTHAVVGSVSAWGARRRGAEYTHVVKGAKLVCATQRLWVEVHRDPQHAPRQDLHCKLGAVGCRGRPSGGDEALWRQARAGSVVRRRSPCKRMAYRSDALGAASVRRSSGGQCISAMMASSISRLPALTCAA